MPLPPACQAFIQDLSPFVDGELSAARRQAVERHLAACADCTARVADFRAEAGLVRLGLEMMADEVDFKDFGNQVLAKLTPEKPPLLERFALSFAEMFRYQRWQLATGIAVAALALLVGLVLSLRPAPKAGYGSAEVAVQSVSTDQGAKVAPVVLKTQQGDAIIWLVGGSAASGTDAGQPVHPAVPNRPTGGEL